MSKCEVTSMPCHKHWDAFMKMHEEADQTVHFHPERGVECDYCKTEEGARKNKDRYSRRCSRCKDGTVVAQHRDVQRARPFGGGIGLTDFHTYIGPTLEYCTQGCVVKVKEAEGWDYEREAASGQS